jgi:hypothetical protein
MFPQTPHIECVALFEKVGPSAPSATPTYGVAAAEGSAAAESDA